MVNFSIMTFLFFIVLPIGLCVLEIFLSHMDNYLHLLPHSPAQLRHFRRGHHR